MATETYECMLGCDFAYRLVNLFWTKNSENYKRISIMIEIVT